MFGSGVSSELAASSTGQGKRSVDEKVIHISEEQLHMVLV